MNNNGNVHSELEYMIYEDGLWYSAQAYFSVVRRSYQKLRRAQCDTQHMAETIQ
jgi:hypothetical protein